MVIFTLALGATGATEALQRRSGLGGDAAGCWGAGMLLEAPRALFHEEPCLFSFTGGRAWPWALEARWKATAAITGTISSRRGWAWRRQHWRGGWGLFQGCDGAQAAGGTFGSFLFLYGGPSRAPRVRWGTCGRRNIWKFSVMESGAGPQGCDGGHAAGRTLGSFPLWRAEPGPKGASPVGRQPQPWCRLPQVWWSEFHMQPWVLAEWACGP